MKKISMLLVAIALGLSSVGAMAEESAAPADGKRHPKMHDCSKMTNADHKARCETRQAAMASCKDKPQGQERRACLKSAMGGKH